MSDKGPDEESLRAAGLDEMDAVRADIEATRADLAETVDALGEKLDVKARANDKVSEMRQRIADTAVLAKRSAPPQVQHALEVTGEKLGPYVSEASTKAAPHRNKIIAGAAAALVLLMILRRRRGDS